MERTMDRLGAQPGTDALLLACATEQSVVVGRLGTLSVRPGYYIYVGSAGSADGPISSAA